MRYLGNKTQLLQDIEAAGRRLGHDRGTVCDLFAGSGVVGRHFRSVGNRVVSTDLMRISYVFQKLFLELEAPPRFEALRRALELPAPSPPGTRPVPMAGDWQPTLRVYAHLLALDPRAGLLTRQYSPAGEAGRGYFRAETAGRIDAMLETLREWCAARLVSEAEGNLLLAAIIDAADRRANISGTYGAYLKRWQSNTDGALELRLPQVEPGPAGEANHEDAFDFAPRVRADLVYLDPPYNDRQYPANYHLLEIIARIPHEADLAAFEASIYGKTGLIPWEDRRSSLCSRRGDRCRDSFRELLQRLDVPCLVISYSEEGIIGRDDFEEMLAEYAGVPRAALAGHLTEIPYRRFRSDADGRVAVNGASRSYKQVEGRERDEVCEWLFHIRRRGLPARSPVAKQGAR